MKLKNIKIKTGLILYRKKKGANGIGGTAREEAINSRAIRDISKMDTRL